MDPNIQQAAIDAATRHNVDPTALLTVLRIEDPSGDPAAVNPKSGATGLSQFMPATAAQYGLTDRTDSAASIDAAARYMADNNATLTKALGRPPSVGEQYLAYQQGAGGAIKLLANPTAPATSIVGHAAVTQNGGNAGMTAAQFASIWTDKAAQLSGAVNGPIDTSAIAYASPGTPATTAIDSAAGSSGPFNYPSAAAPAAPTTWTSPQGNVYRVGDVLKTGNAGAGESNYVITANGPQKLGYTPANTGPTIMSGIVGKVAQQAVQQAEAAAPALVSNAASTVGNLFHSLFPGGNSASAAAPAPKTAPAGPLSYASPSSGADDRSDWGYIDTPAPISAPKSISSVNYGGPAISGTELPFTNGGWGTFSAPAASAQSIQDGEFDAMGSNYGVADSAIPRFITIKKQEQVPFSEPLDQGGGGVVWDAALGNYRLATPAAPRTRTVTKSVQVPNPAYKAPVAGPIAPLPVASTNGYTYLPNGNGGYTRAGVVNPALTPSQQYAAAASKASASQPNGDPFGNVGGVSTTGYNLQTGGQGGNNASGNRMQSPGGSLSGAQW